MQSNKPRHAKHWRGLITPLCTVIAKILLATICFTYLNNLSKIRTTVSCRNDPTLAQESIKKDFRTSEKRLQTKHGYARDTQADVFWMYFRRNVRLCRHLAKISGGWKWGIYCVPAWRSCVRLLWYGNRQWGLDGKNLVYYWIFSLWVQSFRQIAEGDKVAFFII